MNSADNDNRRVASSASEAEPAGTASQIDAEALLRDIHSHLLAWGFEDVAARRGRLMFRCGSARLGIFVGETDLGPAILIRARLLRDVALAANSIAHISQRNARLVFGRLSISVSDQGAHRTAVVWLDHTLLATTFDPDELKFSAIALANTADALDDELQSLCGGKRENEP